MTDIFFSYSSKDRERVQQVRDALTTHGFDVFWDQTVPPGVDWDTWIRQHLATAKCVIVFWSVNSVTSKNVRHEATIADNQGKLVPVLLESLTPDQFPMGLYSTQGANLASWTGNPEDPKWEKLKTEVEAKLTPLWVQQRIQELEAELFGLNTWREAIASSDRAFQAQIDKEINAQLDLRREKDLALEAIENLKAQVEELRKIRTEKELNIHGLTENLANTQKELAIALQQFDEEKRRYVEQGDQLEKFSTENEALAQRLKLSEEHCAKIELCLKEYEDVFRDFEENKVTQKSPTEHGESFKPVSYSGALVAGEDESTSKNDEEQPFAQEPSAKLDESPKDLRENMEGFAKSFLVGVLFVAGLFFGLGGLSMLTDNVTYNIPGILFIWLSVLAFFMSYRIKRR